MANHNLAALSLTIETGPNAIWTEQTAEKLRKGDWDEWVEEVIIGTNEDEGTLFAFNLKLLTPEAFQVYLKQGGLVPPSVATTILATYSAISPPSLLNAPASRFFAAQFFVNPAFNLANTLAGTENARSGKKAKVYKYRLRAGVTRLDKGLGIMHAIDLGLVFNTASLWDVTDAEAGSSKVMGDMWVTFASTGVPNPEWELYTPKATTWLTIAPGGAISNELVDNQ
ncbi:carboxylesterase type B [Pseudohyphozyma bogoriensis]|nr:carboxylesterase type B [Pseudohyphozyma bogoriensis]